MYHKFMYNLKYIKIYKYIRIYIFKLYFMTTLVSRQIKYRLDPLLESLYCYNVFASASDLKCKHSTGPRHCTRWARRP